jgi:hypothetical protein
MPSKAIELMAFDVFKTVFHRHGERPGPGGTMLSGALAGLCRCVVPAISVSDPVSEASALVCQNSCCSRWVVYPVAV